MKAKPRFSFEQEKKTSDFAAKAKEKIVKERRAFIGEYTGLRADDLQRDDRDIAQSYCQRNQNARLASAGSLASIMRVLIWYREKQKLTFDTLIFLGHGNKTVMAVGSGRVGFTSPEAEKLFKPEKREIVVGDTNVWASYFRDAAARGCFAAGADGALHVILLGCLTGTGSGEKNLLKVVSQTLYDVLVDEQKPVVVVYGPTYKVDANETTLVLNNLTAIKQEGVQGSDYYLRDFDEKEEAESNDGGVFLACHKVG